MDKWSWLKKGKKIFRDKPFFLLRKSFFSVTWFLISGLFIFCSKVHFHQWPSFSNFLLWKSLILKNWVVISFNPKINFSLDLHVLLIDFWDLRAQKFKSYDKKTIIWNFQIAITFEDVIRFWLTWRHST